MEYSYVSGKRKLSSSFCTVVKTWSEQISAENSGFYGTVRQTAK